MTQVDVTLQERHELALRTALNSDDGHEAAAYIFFGLSRIELDPWDRRARLRLTSYRVEAVPERDLISASGKHITWSTRSFVDACRRAKDEGLVVGIAHSHPSGYSTFSKQDDLNERELVRLARNRNGRTEMLPSILLIGGSAFAGRVWLDETSPVDAASMQVVGSGFRFLNAPTEPRDDAFARQALAFGPAVNVILRRLKIGIVGCGGTGSAVAMLLGRLGVGQVALFDEDIVEVTNLNRLHGATRADADAMRPKVEVVARELARLGLGVRAIPIPHLADSQEARDALLSCDIVFGCTDDHAGRMFINRFPFSYCDHLAIIRHHRIRPAVPL